MIDEVTPAGEDAVDRDGLTFVPLTLRSMVWVTAFAVCLIGSWGMFWAIGPFVGGAVLGMGLLWGMERFVRRAFSAEAILTQRGVGGRVPEKKSWAGKRALWAFALVKYPMVGALLWLATRFWGDRQIVAFLSGFVLLQLVIGLRGLGRYLFPASAASRDSARPATGAPRVGRND